MRAYDEPWYRKLPNWLTDQIYGPDANAQQAAGVRHLAGPENPLNLPAQFSEGVDTAHTGYQLGSPTMGGMGILQAMTALPFPGAKAVGQVTKQEAKGIRAYHGSPHDFDKFDLSKIGTGEGAQAYGHGFYFSENEGVSQYYRDTLSSVRIDNSSPDYHMWTAVHERPSDPAGWLMDERRRLYPYGSKLNTITGPRVAAMEKAIERFQNGDKPPHHGGRMYEVNIKADPEHFLDWDKPMHEQSSFVKKALASGITWIENRDGTSTALLNGSAVAGVVPNKRGEFHAFANGVLKGRSSTPEGARALIENHVSDPASVFNKEFTGPEFNKGNAGFRKPEKSSAYLQEKGIPGIRYLDRFSRGVGEGSRNYVVFDPATIEILRKYGLLGPMAGGAAAGAMNQSPNALYGDQ